MKFLIVGTAGHIDHGKSSLIRSLTGTDPDRLKEEKERGITIDLGFAHLRAGDVQIGFVDVPGHERFIRNMLAGAGGMDAVLFVVAADESVMPQTREHLDICHLLGIRHGIFAVTKIDMVDPQMLPLVEEELRDLTHATSLAGFPVVFVSNLTGEGIPALQVALGELADRTESRVTHQMARLPIDRVFTLRGFGTVVTGTLGSGRLSREDTVQILPAAMTSKIRGLQTYGQKSDTATEGQRTAINLQGIDKNLLSRGMTVTTPGAVRPSQCLDANLFLVSGAAAQLTSGDVVRLHLTTQDTLARAVLLETDSLQPGESALVQFRTRRPLCAWMGDRFIVRRVSPAATIGGGEILNPAGRKFRKKAPETETARRLLQSRGAERLREWILAQGFGADTLLSALSGYPLEYLARHVAPLPGVIVLGSGPRTYCSGEFLQTLAGRLFHTVEQFQKIHPLAPGMKKEELRTKLPTTLPAEIFQHILDELRREGKLDASGEFISLAGQISSLAPADQKLFDRLEQLLAESGVQPPSMRELLENAGSDEKRARNVLFLMQQRSVAVRVAEDLLIHHSHLRQMQAALRKHFPPGTQFSVGQFKDLMGLSRKYAIPFLEYFDRSRVTRRVGDAREVL